MSASGPLDEAIEVFKRKHAEAQAHAKNLQRLSVRLSTEWVGKIREIAKEVNRKIEANKKNLPFKVRILLIDDLRGINGPESPHIVVRASRSKIDSNAEEALPPLEFTPMKSGAIRCEITESQNGVRYEQRDLSMDDPHQDLAIRKAIDDYVLFCLRWVNQS